MLRLAERFLESIREHGVKDAAGEVRKFLHGKTFMNFKSISYYQRKIWPRLPSKCGTFNGVFAYKPGPLNPVPSKVITHLTQVVRSRLLRDICVEPEYERGAVPFLRKSVSPGDSVVVIGGGIGVSATVAAFQAGNDGDVTVYEPSPISARFVEKTVALNGVSDRVSLVQAAVGEQLNVYGMKDARLIDPAELPDADVYEIDCEGAEIEILENWSTPTSSVIVETHDAPGLHDTRVEQLLSKQGYSITDRYVENDASGCYNIAAAFSDSSRVKL